MDGETKDSLRNAGWTFAAMLGLFIGFAACARCEPAKPTKAEEIVAAQAEVLRLVRAERDAAADAVVKADKVVAEQRAVIDAKSARVAELEAEVRRLNAALVESDAALLRCDKRLTRTQKWAWAGWGIAGGVVLTEAIR